MKNLITLTLLCWTVLTTALPAAFAEDIEYHGNEVVVPVNPPEPVMVSFPGPIDGGFKLRQGSFNLERHHNHLVVFFTPGLKEEGEVIHLALEDKRAFSLRFKHLPSRKKRTSKFHIVDKHNKNRSCDSYCTAATKLEDKVNRSHLTSEENKKLIKALTKQNDGLDINPRSSNNYIKADISDLMKGLKIIKERVLLDSKYFRHYRDRNTEILKTVVDKIENLSKESIKTTNTLEDTINIIGKLTHEMEKLAHEIDSLKKNRK